MHQCRQPRTVDGFGQDIDGTERKADATVRNYSDHDNRNVAEISVGLERAQHLPTVSRRHDHVQRDRIRSHRARQIQSLRPVGGMNQAISGAFQTGGQQVACRRIIVDEQHRGGTVCIS